MGRPRDVGGAARWPWLATGAALLAVGVSSAAFASSGDLDPSFANHGIAKVRSPNGSAASHVALQDDGRILVAGQSGKKAMVVRYLRDGSLDPSFSGDGKIVLASGTGGATGVSAGVQDLRLEPDGKIVIATREGVTRLTNKGRLDRGFGREGTVDLPFTPASSSTLSVAVDGDARIILAGTVFTGSEVGMGVARLLPNGDIDPGFGSGGLTVLGFQPLTGFPQSRAVDVAVAGNRVVVLGNATAPRPGSPGFGFVSRWGVAALKPDGQLDGSFGSGGLVTTSFSMQGTADAAELAAYGTGKLLVVGAAGRPESPSEPHPAGATTLALARYRPGGQLDESFSGNGKLLLTQRRENPGASVAIGSAGAILVGGKSASASPGGKWFVARFRGTGQLDRTFGQDGISLDSRLRGGGSTCCLSDLAVQPDQGVVAAGTTGDGSESPGIFTVARFRR